MKGKVVSDSLNFLVRYIFMAVVFISSFPCGFIDYYTLIGSGYGDFFTLFCWLLGFLFRSYNLLGITATGSLNIMKTGLSNRVEV